MQRVAIESMPADELQRIKSAYRFDLEYSRDSCYEMQVRYGWGELMGLVRTIEEDEAEAAAIDGEAIQLNRRGTVCPAQPEPGGGRAAEGFPTARDGETMYGI